MILPFAAAGAVMGFLWGLWMQNGSGPSQVHKSVKLTPDVRAELAQKWGSMTIAPWADTAARGVLARIRHNRPHYEALAQATGAPWWWIAAIHGMEGGARMTARIRDGATLPPGADWTSDALATLREQIGTHADWSMPAALWMGERYNGLGYRKMGLPTPYLWSGTPHYSRGKFVRDRVYDPQAVSKQAGLAVLFRLLGAE